MISIISNAIIMEKDRYDRVQPYKRYSNVMNVEFISVNDRKTECYVDDGCEKWDTGDFKMYMSDCNRLLINDYIDEEPDVLLNTYCDLTIQNDISIDLDETLMNALDVIFVFNFPFKYGIFFKNIYHPKSTLKSMNLHEIKQMFGDV